MRMKTRRTVIGATCAALATSALAQVADSTAETTLQTVTVTANKVEEKLKDVPQSVTLITGEALQERGIRNIADLVREIPNLSSSFVFSNEINFRGINTSTFTNSNPVVIYVDGVPQSSRYAYDALLENVERVEVLRGPQGSLYGKDAIGGVINIVTKGPSDHWSGYVGAELSNQSGKEATFAINGPIVDGRLFFNLSGKVTRNDGWVTNWQPGMDPNANKREDNLFRIGLHFKATADTTLQLNASHESLRNDWIDGGLAPAGMSLDDYSRKQASQTSFDDATTTKTVSDAQSLSIQHKLGGITIDGILTNKSIKIDGDYDGDWSNDPLYKGLTRYQHGKIDTQTQELRFSGGQPGSIRWVGGLYHEREKARNTRYGGQYAGSMIGMPFDVDNNVPSLTKTDTLAAFGQVMMPLSKKAELTLGGRYQRIDKNFRGDVYFTPIGSTGLQPQFSLAGSKTWNAFLPKAALSYDLSPRWKSWVSVAKGYMPGGFNYFPSSPVVADNRFEPQTSTNYEAGIRSDFGRLYLSASLFYMDIKDIHVYSYDTNGLVFVTSNAGKGTSKGAELEASYLLTDRLEISGALGLTRATYDKYPDPSINGNKVEKTPAYTARLGLQYTSPSGFYGRIDVRSQGKRYFNPENTLVQGAYTIADIKAGYKKGQWDIYAYVRNLTNKDYINLAQAYQGGQNMVIFGEPRRFGIGTRYSF